MGQNGLRAEDGRAVIITIAVIGAVPIASMGLRIASRRVRDLNLGMLAMVSEVLIQSVRAATHRNLVFCDCIDSVGYDGYGPPMDHRFERGSESKLEISIHWLTVAEVQARVDSS